MRSHRRWRALVKYGSLRALQRMVLDDVKVDPDEGYSQAARLTHLEGCHPEAYRLEGDDLFVSCAWGALRAPLWETTPMAGLARSLAYCETDDDAVERYLASVGVTDSTTEPDFE